jgi:hypothetical protein
MMDAMLRTGRTAQISACMAICILVLTVKGHDHHSGNIPDGEGASNDPIVSKTRNLAYRKAFLTD